MPAERAISHRFTVGPWTCNVTAPPSRPASGVAHVVHDWTPAFPSRPLTAAEKAQLRAGLARVLQLVTDAQGAQ